MQNRPVLSPRNLKKKSTKTRVVEDQQANMEASTPADEAELNLLLAMEKMTENIMCTIDAKICSVL